MRHAGDLGVNGSPEKCDMLPKASRLLNRTERTPDNSRHLAAENATGVALQQEKKTAGAIDAAQHNYYAA